MTTTGRAPSHQAGTRSTTLSGVDLRRRRLFRPGTEQTLILAMDHAVTSGPGPGLRDAAAVVAAAAQGGADAVLLRPAMARALAADSSARLGVIMMLTGRLVRGVDHVGMNTVEHALRSGADAVCGEFKFGGPGDLENVRLVAGICEAAHANGLPVLVTVYAVDEAIRRLGDEAYPHACRIAEEIGADLIKTSIPDVAEVVDACLESVTVPVVLAGGGDLDAQGLSAVISRGVARGLAGAAVGRAAWSAPVPVDAVRMLALAAHGSTV